MTDFIQGKNRPQGILLPKRLDDDITQDSRVRVIDFFVDELDLCGSGFRTDPNDMGRSAYHPGTFLKIYTHGYLNRVQTSRRLEREAQRNVELMWLTGRLARLNLRCRKARNQSNNEETFYDVDQPIVSVILLTTIALYRQR